MKKLSLLILLMALFLNACAPKAIAIPPRVTPQPENTPTATVAPIATEQIAYENYGVMQTSLEIVRDGKTYEMFLGYIPDKLFLNGAPTQELPTKYSANSWIGLATIEWVGDIDLDGETEYIVEILYCGTSCSSRVEVIHYDPTKDEYRAFASLDIASNNPDEYSDLDGDGNPEIVTKDFDYNLNVGGCGMCMAVSPIKIYHYDGNQKKFIDVTSQFPKLVQNDADTSLKSIKEHYEENADDLMLASYLYDMYILGKQQEGITTFSRVCLQYVKPTIENPNWTCDKYLSEVEKVLLEMKIGS